MRYTHVPWWKRLLVKAAPHAPLSMISPYYRHNFRKWNYQLYCEEGYQRNPYVFRSVSFLAGCIGGLEWQLFRRMDDGTLEDAGTDHALLRLLRRPNRYTGTSMLMQQMVTNLLVGGRTHLLKIGPDTNTDPREDGRRPPMQLYGAGPDLMDFERSRQLDPGIERFVYCRGTEQEKSYKAEDVVYLRMFHPTDPLDGFPPLAAAARAVDMNNEAAVWNMSLLKNGARPSGLFSVDEPLSDDEYSRAKEAIQRELGGAGKAGLPLLLEGGAKWEQISFSPDKMSWEALTRVTGRETALTLNVPPEVVGDSSTKTHANYRQAVKSAWTEGVLPLADYIVDEFNVQLVPDFEGDGEDLCLTYNRDAIEALSEDRDSLWKRNTDAVLAGIITRNEARAEMGFEDEIEGGDVLTVPANQMPIEAVTGLGAGAEE